MDHAAGRVQLGNGSFLVTNQPVQVGSNVFGGSGAWNFATASQAANVQAVTGDFNHDGFTDIALVGGPWSTIKLALSYGNGNFSVLDESAPCFASWASTPNVKVLTGDFNGDGYTDLALTGVAGYPAYAPSQVTSMAMAAPTSRSLVAPTGPRSRWPSVWAAESSA